MPIRWEGGINYITSDVFQSDDLLLQRTDSAMYILILGHENLKGYINTKKMFESNLNHVSTERSNKLYP